jgi:hypothetical protein
MTRKRFILTYYSFDVIEPISKITFAPKKVTKTLRCLATLLK